MIRDLTKLTARTLIGGYVAGHGAQKLFGAFGGRGLEGSEGPFESLGLRPGKEMAAIAGATELGGGALTVLGHLHPVGPIAVASTMGVAAATAHRGKGAFASTGGPELPVAYLAGSLGLAACSPGRLHVGKVLPGWVGALVGLAGAGIAVAMVHRSMQARAAASAEVRQEDRPGLGYGRAV